MKTTVRNLKRIISEALGSKALCATDAAIAKRSSGGARMNESAETKAKAAAAIAMRDGMSVEDAFAAYDFHMFGHGDQAVMIDDKARELPQLIFFPATGAIMNSIDIEYEDDGIPIEPPDDDPEEREWRRNQW